MVLSGINIVRTIYPLINLLGSALTQHHPIINYWPGAQQIEPLMSLNASSKYLPHLMTDPYDDTDKMNPASFDNIIIFGFPIQSTSVRLLSP